MIKYALFTYTPKRYMKRADFETMDIAHMILSFKKGRKYAIQWAISKVSTALSAMKLKETIIVCVPASCQQTTGRRFRTFLDNVCSLTGAINGFDHILVEGKRKKVHLCHEYPEFDNIIIDTSFFKGRKVIIIDDIYTTGRTSDIFISKMTEIGAEVCLALFLAKTKYFKKS